MKLVLTLFLMFTFYPVSAQREQNIIFKNGEITLVGTLTFPTETGVYPGVIITLGSGSQNRDCEVEGMKPFKLVAAELAKNGFVVLRYDNRSKGLSSGKPIEQSTTEDLATDAQAAFNCLKSQKSVDKRRIGFVGHSEGATIAAIAVSKNPEAKFLIVINGTSTTGFDNIILDTEQRLRKAGKSNDKIQYYLKNLTLYLGRPASITLEERKIAARNIIMFEISQLSTKGQAKITKREIESYVNSQMHDILTRWQKQYLTLNPASYYKEINCPVSLFFSDTELEGLLSKRITLFKKVLSADNQPYNIKVIKNTDHNLINTKSGIGQYAKSVSSDFVNLIAQEAKQVILTNAL